MCGGGGGYNINRSTPRSSLPVWTEVGSGDYAQLYSMTDRAQELCESRGGRHGLPVPDSPSDLGGRKATLHYRRQSSGAV